MTYLTEKADPVRAPTGKAIKLCVGLGFVGGFLFAYQRSSCMVHPIIHSGSIIITLNSVRFWGWTENSREYEKDFKELSQRTKEGKSLYGESSDPEFVQVAAHRNSQWSQLKFCESFVRQRVKP